MTDVWFVVAAWAVILGGLTLYAVMLLRRLRSAREATQRIRRAVDDAQPHGDGE